MILSYIFISLEQTFWHSLQSVHSMSLASSGRIGYRQVAPGHKWIQAPVQPLRFPSHPRPSTRPCGTERMQVFLLPLKECGYRSADGQSISVKQQPNQSSMDVGCILSTTEDGLLIHSMIKRQDCPGAVLKLPRAFDPYIQRGQIRVQTWIHAISNQLLRRKGIDTILFNRTLNIRYESTG